MSNNFDFFVKTNNIIPPRLIQPSNPNICCIVTDQPNTIVNSSKRTAVYSDFTTFSKDFNSTTEVYKLAQAFFNIRSNPLLAGGRLVIGYWRKNAETLAATSGVLRGAELSPNVLDTIKTISQGYFTFSVDGGAGITVSADFTTVTSFTDLAEGLDTIIGTAATVTFDTNTSRFVFTSATTGASSEISFTTDLGGAGTYIGSLLGLTQESGAQKINGLDTQNLTAIKAEQDISGACFVTAVHTQPEVSAVAGWANTNKVLIYETFFSTDNLNDVSTNPVNTGRSFLTGAVNYYRMLFSIKNPRTFSAAYMSRTHSVNFQGGFTITLNAKTLEGLLSDDLTNLQISNALTLGLDVYIPLAVGAPNVIKASVNNGTTDTTYNSKGIQKYIDTFVINSLIGTPTKIPQTEEGMDIIKASVRQVMQTFVINGYIAPGAWRGDIPSNTNPDIFLSAISTNGYDIFSDPIATQPLVDRQQRQSPQIYIFYKEAGSLEEVFISTAYEL